MRIGLSLGICSQRPSAAPAPSGPVILNGDFTDTSHWTIASGGGAASMSIAPGSPGTLNSVSGSGNMASTCTQTLSGCIPGQLYTIPFTVTARNNGALRFSLGGGAEVSGASNDLGPDSVTATCGAANQDLVIHPASGIGGRTVSITNIGPIA